MALTIGEAQAVNDLIRYTMALHNRAGDRSPDAADRARAAAVLLAGHAHKPLMAGLTSVAVATHWTEAP